ncbi:DUF402 domain-containing protein [Kytococcus sedentarius]|uniref:DUF402 domain-containing protein n=1 Tax=Kytococcus sedentarius TaxID=1276 RepID=UPI0035BBE639
MTFWQPGEVIHWCYGPPAAQAVHPMRVVRDDEAGLVAWLAVGTPALQRVRADGRPVRSDPATLFTAPRVVAPRVWETQGVLRIQTPGQWWSVWLLFAPGTHEFRGWYVNIEQPHVREGQRTMSDDLVLDVVVDPQRNASRKDEDELELAVEQGRFTPDEATRIQAVADEAEAVIDAWGSPFCDGWESFQPDPAWGLPPAP